MASWTTWSRPSSKNNSITPSSISRLARNKPQSEPVLNSVGSLRIESRQSLLIGVLGTVGLQYINGSLRFLQMAFGFVERCREPVALIDPGIDGCSVINQPLHDFRVAEPCCLMKWRIGRITVIIPGTAIYYASIWKCSCQIELLQAIRLAAIRTCFVEPILQSLSEWRKR